MIFKIKTVQIFIAAAMLLSFSMIACQREKLSPACADCEKASELAKSNFSVNGNAPAAFIAASEKLEIPASVQLPENLPAGNSRVATYFAEGVQKYVSRVKAGSDPVVYEWAFVAPYAVLYDANNALVGDHNAGPTWALSPADSIFAQHFSPARTAPASDPESIDWLLLKPKAGTVPTGIFKDVAYIQRIATKGGKAPLTPPVAAGQTVEVKYKAVYRFSKIN